METNVLTRCRSVITWGGGQGVQARVAGRDYERTQGNFCSDGYVHHLDYSDGFMGVHESNLST